MFWPVHWKNVPQSCVAFCCHNLHLASKILNIFNLPILCANVIMIRKHNSFVMLSVCNNSQMTSYKCTNCKSAHFLSHNLTLFRKPFGNPQLILWPISPAEERISRGLSYGKISKICKYCWATKNTEGFWRQRCIWLISKWLICFIVLHFEQ